MSRKSIKFEEKKINKSYFYINKKIFKTDDIDINKILVSKEESYGKKNHLNTSLDIMMMMMMSLEHHVQSFFK